MKKRNLLKIFVSVIALFAFFGIMGNVNAAPYQEAKSAKLTGRDTFDYSDTFYGGTWETADFHFTAYSGYASGNNPTGTQLASSAPGICMLPKEKSPDVNDVFSADKQLDANNYALMPLVNVRLIKYMYYGLCPSGCTRDVFAEVFRRMHPSYTGEIPKTARILIVHSAMSQYNLKGTDKESTWSLGLTSSAITDTNEFMEEVDAIGSTPDSQDGVPTGVFAYKIGGSDHQTVAFIYTVEATLKINKVSSNAPSNVSLAGAKYAIYSENTCTQRAVMDKNGTLYPEMETNAQGNTPDYTIVGRRSYWIKETATPSDKFLKDTECHLCDLYNSDTCTVTSDDKYVEEPKVYIKKEDTEGHSLRNAKFKVFKDNCDTGELVEELTLSNSEAIREIQSPLTDGQYYCVREIEAPDGYEKAEDQGFTFDQDVNIVTLTFQDEKTTKGSVRIRKTDSTHNPLQNAKFTIYKNHGCTGSAVRTITTGQDGVASYGNLDLGEYCIKETTAPTGYKLSTNTYDFDITNEEKDYVFTEDIVNEGIRGKLKIVKSIEPVAGVKVDLTNNPNYTFGGATFNIYKGECGSGGRFIEVATIPAGQSTVTVGDLELGTYCVAEKDPPKGYYRTNVEVTRNLTSSSVVTFSFQDAPRFGTLKLIKYSNNESLLNSDLEKYSLQGAEFKITNEAGDDMGTLVVGPYVEGVGFETNTLHDIPFGTYYAKEVKGPDNGLYDIDENIYPVTISQSDSDPSKENGVFRATNKFKKGEAYVNKVPAEEPDGSCTLAGAEYAVCKDEDCREVVVTLITKEDGKTQTEKLEPGVYYFQEQKAPDCFEVNSEVQRITVASGTTVEVTSKEQLIPKNPKTGIDNPYLITITTVAIGSAGLYFLRRKNAFRQI